jgi:ornithine carbamoyltransferase
MTMGPRHFLSIPDAGPHTVAELVARSLAMARGEHDLPLADRIVGVYFRRSSTRTRTAFSAGALNLGAGLLTFGPTDLQLATGETIEDTARVLSSYLDVLVIRTNETLDEMRVIAAHADMAVVNALSDDEHPTQTIADLTALKEEFGDFDGLHVLYVGEGNNTAASLALAVAQTAGMRLTLASPPGYGLSETMLTTAHRLGQRFGGSVEQQHGLDRLPAEVDAVYTSRWQTMGDEKPDPRWRETFAPYKVTSVLLEQVSGPHTIFLHDLPAVRGGDVDDDVLDGPQSRAFRQAYHKMTSAMAVLEWCAAELPKRARGFRPPARGVPERAHALAAP